MYQQANKDVIKSIRLTLQEMSFMKIIRLFIFLPKEVKMVQCHHFMIFHYLQIKRWVHKVLCSYIYSVQFSFIFRFFMMFMNFCQ